MMHVIFTGERVRLRPFIDAQELTGLIEELDLQEHYFWAPEWWPKGRIEKLFEKYGMLDSVLHFSYFAIERLDTGELIGTEVAEIPSPGVIQSEIGTVILKRHWCQGFGREAKQLAMCFVFENFPVETVTAGTLSTHSRAIAGLEAVGMSYVGKHHGRPLSNGRYASVVHYAITRHEWEQHSIRRTAVRGV